MTRSHGVGARAARALLALSAVLPALPLGAQPVAREGAGSEPLIPVTVRWPLTTAVATVAPGRGSPTAIEATSDGWVVLTPLGHWSDVLEGGTSTRLRVRPRDAVHWVRAARRLLGPSGDSLPPGLDGRVLPKLGRGRVYLEGYVPAPAEGPRLSFQLMDCAGVRRGYNMERADLARLADHVERAAAIAMQGAATPTPPTLDRPYYDGEVSCPVVASPANAAPRFPAGTPAAERRYGEVGVRFVVDTLGDVEPGSVVVLAGAPPALERAARTLVAGWRFRPAVWFDYPVRQVVTTVLAFDPDAPPPAAPTQAEITAGRRRTRSVTEDSTVVRAGTDGRVHVRRGHWDDHGRFRGYQEWYHPDSVRLWVAQVDAFLTADSTSPRRPPPPNLPEPTFVLGHGPMGNLFVAGYQQGWSPETEFLEPHAWVRGCGNALVWGGRLDRPLVRRFDRASAEARARRATPAPQEDREYLAGEVACAAYLPPIRAVQAHLPGVWRHPRAGYPGSMEPTNAMAEVLSSFVVDTTGTADPATLVVAPGSDPRAVAALRETLGHYRFRPAARGGVKVRSRVIRTWHFVPAPVCEDDEAGIECRRVYSQL